ncbi:hypothetical protein LUZ61_004998 [Rhynchospora tenuis]|uniref:SKP1-like protein n=1 Tax=Rhynchospora tenuis TaxID=198213 RepID=A0AAD6EU72_9POAL|nr:hypothetical protein LUZ61_004998 [Rhynchospora tenuis]
MIITLISSDKRKFHVIEEVAKQSLAIRDVIGDGCVDRITLVTNVNSRILEKVILYGLRHVSMAGVIAHGSKPHKEAEKLKKWEAKFFDTDIDTLNGLILAADPDSLNIPGLFDGACEKVADILKDNSLENEFTPEEEEMFRREIEWIPMHEKKSSF